MHNSYQDEQQMRQAVQEGRHREVIGGLWDEIGALQFEFLKARGMKPEHKLLDLGCGSGRLAVQAVPYLQPECYYGMDISPALLSAARREIERAGYGNKISDRSLYATADFCPSPQMPSFDFGIAQSVFTHLPLNCLTFALNAIRRNFEPGGRFFATFFVAPRGMQDFCHKTGGIVSHCDRDPFHFDEDVIIRTAREAGWRARWIGAWGHPREQQISEFVPA
jgi:SAM-dependent methyltransferase